MMALLDHYPWLKSLWTVWFFAMFVALIISVMLPSRRQHLQKMAEIPFKDEREEAALRRTAARRK